MIHRVTVVLPVRCLCVTNTLLVVWEYGTSGVLYFLLTSALQVVTVTLPVPLRYLRHMQG